MRKKIKMLPYELWLAVKYSGILNLRNRRDDKLISFISLVSVIGITIGVASLIVVMSVMNGFQRELHKRILSIVPHIEIFIPGADSQTFASLYQNFEKEVRKDINIKHYAPFSLSQGIILKDNKLNGIQIQGIDSNFVGSYSLEKNLLFGNLSNLKEGSFRIILGAELLKSMNLQVGDNVYIVSSDIFTESGSDIISEAKKFQVEGVFSSGYYEYDSSVVFVDIKDFNSLFINKNMINGIRFSLDNIYSTQVSVNNLRNILPNYFYINDWSLANKIWFDAVQTEKRMMFLILSIIIAIASFNLFSSLVMLVSEKKYDIAIMKTFGVGSINILIIFLLTGLIIGVLGSFIGVLCGIIVSYNVDQIVCFIESFSHVNFLPREAYLVGKLPYYIDYFDILNVAFFSILMSLIATIYPSIKASMVSPARILNNVR